jgi:hypothetical protein
MSRKKGIVFSSEPVLALSLRNNKNSTKATKRRADYYAAY